MTAKNSHDGRVRAGPEPAQDRAPDTGPGVLDELSRTVTALIQGSGRLPAYVCVRLAEASIEAGWAQEDSGHRQGSPGPVAEEGASAPGAPTADGFGEEERAAPGSPVNAPLVGTFYCSPEPGARPFVCIGQDVDAGQQVGIIEAMKLMVPVVSENAGRVTRVLVSDAERVEYDQTLLVLDTEVGG